jgi:ribosomal protein L22
MTEEPEQPRRRLPWRSAADAPSEATPAAEAARAEDEAVAEDETTRAASSSEPTSELPSGDAPESARVAEEPEAEGESELEAEHDHSEDEGVVREAQRPRRSRRRGRRAGSQEQKAPAKPAPARRRRSQRDPSLPAPVVRAQAKYVRSSARKARLVCDHIRGKTVDEARAILAHTPRAIARDWSKLLESAVANAEHNHELVGEDLYVKAVKADEGPTIKRFRPRAMGRATRISKRTSHLTILLTPKE